MVRVLLFSPAEVGSYKFNEPTYPQAIDELPQLINVFCWQAGDRSDATFDEMIGMDLCEYRFTQALSTRARP